jgi:hypothetical protein
VETGFRRLSKEKSVGLNDVSTLENQCHICETPQKARIAAPQKCHSGSQTSENLTGTLGNARFGQVLWALLFSKTVTLAEPSSMLPFPILPQTAAKRSSLPADRNVTWHQCISNGANCYLLFESMAPFLPNTMPDVKPKSGYDRDIVGF